MKYQLEIDENGCIEVAFNSDYGGFSISKEAILRMIELGSEEAKKYYEECKKYNSVFEYYNPKVPRFDPILIKVIKELKNKASGKCASLAIGKVSLDNLVDIDDYDGKEDLKYCYDKEYFGRYDDDE